MAKISNWLMNDPKKLKDHKVHQADLTFHPSAAPEWDKSKQLKGSLFIHRKDDDKWLKMYFSGGELFDLASDFIKEMSDSQLLDFLKTVLATRKPKQ